VIEQLGSDEMKEDPIGVHGWRSRVLEGDLNHWCGKGSPLKEALS